MVKKFRHLRGLALPVVSEVEPSQPKGFSLGELLVVITIVTLLAIAILMGYQNQVAKANDAKRKEDFNKYKIAFEDYYNDKNCYPTEADWNACSCGGNCLSPYMDKFLCDPTTRARYLYLPPIDDDVCSGYRLFAKLENKGDPDISASGCSWALGCGKDAPLSQYNYGIAMGGRLTAVDFYPNPSPAPVPGLDPKCYSATGPHACSNIGDCEGFRTVDFTNGRCSVGFKNASCCISSHCDPHSIWCRW
jgi:prepilin-type N-terminal cleavage/methylation domain-containing protein